MPTSSQALILLSTDGRLPTKVPRHVFPVNSVPYPTRNLDINASCVEYDDTADEYSGDVVTSRRKRIRVDDILDSLPELLTIRGYKGALSYDSNAKVLRWKVDTEVPKSRMDTFLTYRDDPYLKPDYYREPRVRFPPIYDEGNQETIRLYNIENTYRYPPQRSDLLEDNMQYYNNGHSLYHKPQRNSSPSIFGFTNSNGSESPRSVKSDKETVKHSVSFPSLFKATIDEDTYKRLYDLGFRRENHAKNEKSQGHPKKKSDKRRTKFQAWESVDDYADKDFRLEDLNLKTELDETGSKHHRFKLTHNNLPPPGVALSEYLADRESFFAKFRHYTSDREFPKEMEEQMFGQENTRSQLPDLIPEKLSAQNSKSPGHTDDDVFVQSDVEVKSFQPQTLSLIDNCSSMTNYNKWKKQKLTTVRMRKDPPVPQPLSACFSLIDNAKSHMEVKELIQNQIGSPVTRLQFDPISVHALDNKAKSRWVVTFSDKDTVDFLVSSGLIIDGEKVEVRLFDEALKEEVEAYRLYQMVQRGEITMPSYNKSRRRKDRNSSKNTT